MHIGYLILLQSNDDPATWAAIGRANEARVAAYAEAFVWIRGLLASPLRWLARLVAARLRRQVTARELGRLNDRMLADIGLSRAEIPEVARSAGARDAADDVTVAELRGVRSAAGPAGAVEERRPSAADRRRSWPTGAPAGWTSGHGRAVA